jgi:hypothetical protein
LLKEQWHQHIVCGLLCGGTLPHGASRRLDDTHEAPFGREKRDQIVLRASVGTQGAPQ